MYNVRKYNELCFGVWFYKIEGDITKVVDEEDYIEKRRRSNKKISIFTKTTRIRDAHALSLFAFFDLPISARVANKFLASFLV